MKKLNRILAIILVLAALTAVCACGGDKYAKGETGWEIEKAYGAGHALDLAGRAEPPQRCAANR